MKKNRVFVMGVLAVALTFTAVQRAEAQSAKINAASFFTTVTDRDEWMLARLEASPHYIAVHSDTLTKALDFFFTVDSMFAPRLQDVGYVWLDGNLVAIFSVQNAQGLYSRQAVIIQFATTQEVAQNNYNENRNEGSHALGPFNAGSTDASRRAALQRIIASITSFKNSGVAPQNW